MHLKGLLAIALAFGAGFGAARTTVVEPVVAQAADRQLVEGSGRANSGLRPPGEVIGFMGRGLREKGFRAVPESSQLVLTDVMFNAQGSVTETITVNIAISNPVGPPNSRILFQTRVAPGESRDVHLCSGYVVPSGYVLVAYTNGGLQPGQYVSLSATGYLTGEGRR